MLMLYFIRCFFSLLFQAKLACRHQHEVSSISKPIMHEVLCPFNSDNDTTPNYYGSVSVTWSCCCGRLRTKKYQTDVYRSKQNMKYAVVALYKQMCVTHGVPYNQEGSHSDSLSDALSALDETNTESSV